MHPCSGQVCQVSSSSGSPVDCGLDACSQLLCCLIVVAVGVDHDGVSVAVDDLAGCGEGRCTAARQEQATAASWRCYRCTAVDRARPCAKCSSAAAAAPVQPHMPAPTHHRTPVPHLQAAQAQLLQPPPPPPHASTPSTSTPCQHTSTSIPPSPSPPGRAGPAPAPGPRWTAGCHDPGT
jgi:hypothetical protein